MKKHITLFTVLTALLFSGSIYADDPKISSVTLDKEATISAQETLQLTATVLPAEAAAVAKLTWTSDNTSVAKVDQNGLVTGVAVGTANISVKAETSKNNKTAKCKVTVGSPLTDPETGDKYTIHIPEIYEAKEVAGGYNGKLSVFGGREYEVYYINRDANTYLSVATTNGDKAGSITQSDNKNKAEARDGWLKVATASGYGGETGAAEQDEFAQSIDKISMKEGDAVTMRVKGFDQFSLYAKDNGGVPKCLTVYINGKKQPMTTANAYSIRRFDSSNSDFTSGDNFIKIIASSSSASAIVAFSLRVSDQPRTKHIKGNDSSQVVLQTASPKPIYYYTKYNSKGETKLVWEGAEATGITLEKGNHDAVGDTLVLGGEANCPIGTYRYRVVSFYNGTETSSVNGRFTVKSELKFISGDTILDAYQNDEIDEIKFRYYALSADDVKLTWEGNAPTGISASGKNGIYIISGAPQETGVFKYTVSVTGGNSINGTMTISELDMGNDPILYLHKNNHSYDNDGVYAYLKTAAGGNRNFIARKAQDGLRPADQYAKYKWILISEDVDADNPEVLAIARGEAKLPVLNMKSFTYSPDRLGWGEPDNGTLDTVTHNGCNILIQRADHPVFTSLGWEQNKSYKVLDKVEKKGLMPIRINHCDGSVALAASYTRNIDDYYKDGQLQTILHEIPAAKHKGHKYICFPLAQTSSKHLSADGKKLVNALVTYLLDNSASVELPELRITSFTVNGIAATIGEDTIRIRLDKRVIQPADIKPEVTVASPYTHVEPLRGDKFDFSYCAFEPVVYVVTDYINRRTYDVVVEFYGTEGIEEVYAVGEWVNIYDIHGRLLTSTNENVYTMQLPHGMYMVVTENGKTLKIMK